MGRRSIKIEVKTAQKSCQRAVTIRRAVLIIFFLTFIIVANIIKNRLKLGRMTKINGSPC
jgi:hypothetical protein